MASKRDRYRRLLAVCTVDGEDLGAAIIRDGLAVAYRYRDKASNPEYLSIEAEVREADRGLWGSEFKMPREWWTRK